MKRFLTALVVVALIGYAWWNFTRPDGTVDVAPSAPAASLTPSAAPTVTQGQVLDADTSEPPEPTGPRPTVTPEPLPTHQASAMPTVTATATGHPRSLPGQAPSTRTPEDAATAFVERYFTVDTSVDQAPAAGRARASKLATAELAKTLVTGVDNGRPGGQWLQLLEHHGWTETKATIVVLGDAPADSTVAYRTVRADVDLHGADSWVDTAQHLMSLELTRQGAGWKVSKYQLLN